MALFSASYAIASLGCTIGPFLAVVVAGFRTDSVASGIGLFLAYAARMGILVGTIALAVALGRVSPARGLRRAGPLIVRVAGALLVVAGAYVAWFAWYEIGALRGGPRSPTRSSTAPHGSRRCSPGGLTASARPASPSPFAVLLVTTAVLIRCRRASGPDQARTK